MGNAFKTKGSKHFTKIKNTLQILHGLADFLVRALRSY